MKCRVTDLRNKEVICRCNGAKLGCVDDVEIDINTARLVSIVIFGRLKFFGIFGRYDDIVICWDNIVLIGEDTILVDCNPPLSTRKKRKVLPFKFFIV